VTDIPIENTQAATEELIFGRRRGLDP